MAKTIRTVGCWWCSAASLALARRRWLMAFSLHLLLWIRVIMVMWCCLSSGDLLDVRVFFLSIPTNYWTCKAVETWVQPDHWTRVGLRYFYWLNDYPVLGCGLMRLLTCCSLQRVASRSLQRVAHGSLQESFTEASKRGSSRKPPRK